MQKALDKLSASELRLLLIDEIRVFILGLEVKSTEELEAMKLGLKEIFVTLSEKEEKEMAPIRWGKKISESGKDLFQSDMISDILRNSRED